MGWLPIALEEGHNSSKKVMISGGVRLAEWITEKELCEWLGISTTTAWRWRKQGMPYMGKKKSIRYNKKEVEKWLKQRKNK